MIHFRNGSTSFGVSGRKSHALIAVVVLVIGTFVLTAGPARAQKAEDELVQAGDFSARAAKTMSLAVIEIIDLFLIGTVAYITAVGLYKLFIGGMEIRMPMRLQIESLKDLEDKIIGVLVAALAVAFLGHAAGGDEARALLNYGGGIALVIGALAYFTSQGGKKIDAGNKK